MWKSILGLVAVAVLAGPLMMRAGEPAKADKTGAVKGEAVYNDKARDNIKITLTPAETSKDAKSKPKPLSATTDEKGAFEFKSVPVGKYKVTAAGKPSDFLRKLKEADILDLEVAEDDTATLTVKLTLDR